MATTGKLDVSAPKRWGIVATEYECVACGIRAHAISMNRHLREHHQRNLQQGSCREISRRGNRWVRVIFRAHDIAGVMLVEKRTEHRILPTPR